jgi:1-acyl-sn-glycerol-3-phosphate acyltransferase
MAGGTRKRSAARKRTGGGTRRHALAARPALGNDPFARGAAPREPAPPLGPSPPPDPPPASVPVPVPSASPGPPASPPARPDRPEPAQRLAHLEQRVDAALEGAEERLLSLAGRAGLLGSGQELREVLGKLLPRIQAGFGAAFELLRRVEHPERLDRFGMDPQAVERFAPLGELLYGSWWRTTVRDPGHVPAEGPAIVAANHAGVVPWDALVLRHALRRDHPAHRELRPLLDDRECALTLVGGAMVRLGAVRSSPAAATSLLADGQLVGVFPEGSAGARKPWRERYRLQRFGRGGFVKLALRTGAPIIPCAIVGSEEASPGISRTGWLAERLGVPFIGLGAALRFGPAALLPLPSRWSLRFGPAVALQGLGPSDADDLVAVAAASERIRGAIQAMLDEDLAARTSVFL